MKKVFTGEVWKDIKGYEGKYQVSNHGRILSLNFNRSGRARELKAEIDTDNEGYHKITLMGKKHMVSRLVAEAFVENPYNYNIVNHIDSDVSNNHASNLEWVTQQQNVQHSYTENGNRSTSNGIPKRRVKGKVIQYGLNGKFIAIHSGVKAASDASKAGKTSIYKCCAGIARRKAAGGYQWRFYTDNFLPEIPAYYPKKNMYAVPLDIQREMGFKTMEPIIESEVPF